MYAGERLTAEEDALHELWLVALGEERGAHEAVRFANIRLRDAMEAVHLACHNFETLRRKNAEERGE